MIRCTKTGLLTHITSPLSLSLSSNTMSDLSILWSHELADGNTSHQSWGNSTVSGRIDFKLAVLYMYQISRGLALTYLQDRCRFTRLASEVSSGRRLRSANVRTFMVPRTRTKLGVRSFAGPRLWNSLPGPLRQSETIATFKRHLKTFLFSY